MAPLRSRPARVFVDMDDVLAETTRTLLDHFHHHFGHRFVIEDVVHFDLARSLSLDDAGYERFMEIVHEDPVLDSIAPRDGAAGALARWTAAGCEIAVMTGRPPSTEPVSRRWLERNGIAHASLGFVDKYGRRDWRGGARRGIGLEELRRMAFDLAVEDSLSTAVFLAETMRVPVALMDRPWNRDTSGVPVAAADRLVRCRDWSEVEERFPVRGSAPAL